MSVIQGAIQQGTKKPSVEPKQTSKDKEKKETK